MIPCFFFWEGALCDLQKRSSKTQMIGGKPLLDVVHDEAHKEPWVDWDSF